MFTQFKVTKYFPATISWYIILFGLYSIMTRFTLTRMEIEGLPNNILYTGFFIIGFLLAAYGIASQWKTFLGKENILLLLFLGILVISSLYNYHYDLYGNIKTIITVFTQLVLFYYIMTFLSKEELQKCLKMLFLITNILWLIPSVGSLIQFLFNINYSLAYIEERTIRQGFIEGRLFGFFSDPNFAAFTSLLLIYGLCYLLMKTKVKAWRIGIITSAIIHVFYIVMSNSRTVYIAVLLSVVFFVFLHTKKKMPQCSSKTIVFRTLTTLISCVAVYFAVLGIMELSGYLITPERNIAEEMVRNDVSVENISNNRTAIWKDYLELYKTKPILGTSPRGALLYASEVAPDSYISLRQYVTHNGYLSLLVTSGILGFIIMLLFLIIHSVKINRWIANKNELDEESILFITIILAILVFTFFFTDIFFSNNLETMLLWIGFGYLKAKSS